MNVKESLCKVKIQINENINSHVFLVETNNIEFCLNDIKKMIGEIVSQGNINIQNQVQEENYLEQIIIRPDGKEIKKDQILELQKRIKTKPILSNNIYYIITNADKMNEYASNKMLKTIEEPYSNVIGFLIAENQDIILPTIKSRCEKLLLFYENNLENTVISEEILNYAGLLIKSIEDENHIEFFNLKKDSKILKENSRLIVNIIKNYYNTSCNIEKVEYLDKEIINYIKKQNKTSNLIKKSKYLNNTLTIYTHNMNIELLLEKIYFELKEVK